MDLSVLIPARNEMFLRQTVENILENAEGETEVIAVLDGEWADPPLVQHPRVQILYHSQSVGQRAATNEAARLSSAKFVMKADAHCAFDKGFDVKLMKQCEKDWTVVPRMYNLHAFDWQCKKCGNRVYQGPYPTECANNKCKNTAKDGFERVMVWQPRRSRETDFARFDNTLHFQYWGAYKQRKEAVGVDGIADLLCFVGACFFMTRERYWELGGMDERHGSWGQMGVEVACKSWLSGGRLVVNKNTWFSHLFRTQPGFGFPYPNPGIEKARNHSRNLWFNNKWEGQQHSLRWLLEKFWPVPDWTEEELQKLNYLPVELKSGLLEKNRMVVGQMKEALPPTEAACVASAEVPSEPLTVAKAVNPLRPISGGLTKGVVYYTDNLCEERLASAVRQKLVMETTPRGIPIVSVSLKPLPDFGENYVVNGERGVLTMFKQILLGLEKSTADVVFLCEHDVLYHPSHFEFTPPQPDIYYYNENTYKVDGFTGRALFYYTKQTSGLCAYRKLLVEHYQKRVAKVEKDGFSRHMGYEPGCHTPPRGVDNYKAERWMAPFPNVDVRHTTNLTASRWSQDQFRNANACLGWKLGDSVPGWGITKYRFWPFLQEVADGVVGR